MGEGVFTLIKDMYKKQTFKILKEFRGLCKELEVLTESNHEIKLKVLLKDTVLTGFSLLPSIERDFATLRFTNGCRMFEICMLMNISKRTCYNIQDNVINNLSVCLYGYECIDFES